MWKNKGKEYNNYGKLVNDGEYLNEIRNGYGEEYYDNGTLKFEGEYLDGKRWNGNGYNKNGYKEFEISNGRKIKKKQWKW